MRICIAELALVLTCQKHVELVNIFICKVLRRSVPELMQNELWIFISWVVSAQASCRVLHRYEMHALYFKTWLEQVVNIFVWSKSFPVDLVSELLKVQRREIDHEVRQVNSFLKLEFRTIFNDVVESRCYHR